ncbi:MULTISPECIES: histidine kinase [unclassified Arcicella]|uniref:sensor histidine kinase n=1 Tax=unclassified Arcicella TaxID=2644986 RepID=UPI00286660BB|nr:MULTISPECIES: histidine kinase [unclassified Arcicella]MDR6561076.1 sensor histidine kinase YesM [Arcicella sp. BE51]MDR6810960.1 sensor histidine kinase YesM [Arcicella sp. BE140]MDR6822310.1 sensor histidine kinase YesM [Arcicella sp. BE139]
MNAHERLRPYELFFILLAITLYVVRRLFGIASDFDSDIEYLQNIPVDNSVIWADLSSYDQYVNNIFPTVVAAILFTTAWGIFHFIVSPEIKKKNFDASTIMLLLLSMGLVLASCYVFKEFKLFWRFRYDDFANPIGFNVYSIYRKLHVLTDAVGVMIIIGFYEVVAQAYYYTAELYEAKQEGKYQVLSNVILGISVFVIAFFALFGKVPELIVGSTGLIIGTGQILLTIGVHQFFYKRVIPYFAKINYSKQEHLVVPALLVFIYFLSVIVLYFGWYRIFHRGYFVGIVVLPNMLGGISAIIRWILFQEKKELQTQVFQKSAELTTLRSQINPHFLFNALNTLYAVALNENAEKTSTGIQKLGDMMRFMLHENHQDRIPLSKEIEYLENFIDIQRMRLDESHEIEIRVNIQTLNHEIYIAPMLLNPFVENAFKHGISFRKPSWIYITLTFDANKLYFKVHNSLHPKQENDTEKHSSGIGLENVKKRLELIYPQRYSLDIQQSEQDYFVALTFVIF